MAEPTLEELLAEQARRNETQMRGAGVMEEPGSTFDEFVKAGEALLKGPAKGIINIIGGWVTCMTC